jgi:hypothetical protein
MEIKHANNKSPYCNLVCCKTDQLMLVASRDYFTSSFVTYLI